MTDPAELRVGGQNAKSKKRRKKALTKRKWRGKITKLSARQRHN